jgi:two-component SAPR family response regulator
MTGVDLVREIRRLAGPVPVVIVTGHRQELASYADLAPLKIVDKPFSGDDLGRVLQQVLTAQPDRR